jgi:hypothetical protein
VGVQVIAATKFHGEMVGEGTERPWEAAKSWHPSKPLEGKRWNSLFCNLRQTAQIQHNSVEQGKGEKLKD